MSITDGWADEEAARERARPASDDYTGEPCPVCGRVRVYIRRDGLLQCEKCETIQSDGPSAPRIVNGDPAGAPFDGPNSCEDGTCGECPPCQAGLAAPSVPTAARAPEQTVAPLTDGEIAQFVELVSVAESHAIEARKFLLLARGLVTRLASAGWARKDR